MKLYSDTILKVVPLQLLHWMVQYILFVSKQRVKLKEVKPAVCRLSVVWQNTSRGQLLPVSLGLQSFTYNRPAAPTLSIAKELIQTLEQTNESFGSA